MKYLSLVIPCYNEEKIISNNLKIVVTYLKKKRYSWEIVVVDDGSSDKTYAKAKGFNKKEIRVVRLPTNQGKGAALRLGILESTGRNIVYIDADLSVSITHLDKLIKKLQAGYPMVIGSRRMEGSKIVVHQPYIREKMGQVFTFLTKITTGVNLDDFTCGFKGFSKRAGHDVFKKSLINRWAYDAEVVFLARKLGYKMGKIPVTWVNRSETRVKLHNVIFTSLYDLIKVRFNELRGYYD